MDRYNYMFAIENDVKQYIKDEVDQDAWAGNRDGLEEELNETLFTHDGVTGNASGSYTISTWTAEEYICHNLDLLGEALEEYGCGPEFLIKQGPEAADVTIRCYLLPQCISNVLDELEESGFFDVEEGGEA